jgi:hypothetical protein
MARTNAAARAGTQREMERFTRCWGRLYRAVAPLPDEGEATWLPRLRPRFDASRFHLINRLIPRRQRTDASGRNCFAVGEVRRARCRYCSTCAKSVVFVPYASSAEDRSRLDAGIQIQSVLLRPCYNAPRS